MIIVINLVGVAAAIALGYLARASQERRRARRMVAAAIKASDHDPLEALAQWEAERVPPTSARDLGRRAHARHPVSRETADEETHAVLSAYVPHGLELEPTLRDDHLLEITRRSVRLRWTRQHVLNRALALGLTALDKEQQ